jgi:heat shock protein HslJ
MTRVENFIPPGNFLYSITLFNQLNILKIQKGFSIMSRLYMLFLFFFLLVGCAVKPDQQADNGTNPKNLVIPRWDLVSLVVDGVETSLPPTHQTIQFTADGLVNGEAACNAFGGSYQASSDGTITLSDMVSTLRFCESMEQETAYLKGLGQVRQFHLDGSRLILTAASGKTSLTFQKPPQ